MQIFIALRFMIRSPNIYVEMERISSKAYTAWQTHFRFYIDHIMSHDAPRKQLNYMKNTKKLKRLIVSKWIRRIKNIKSLLSTMGGIQMNEKELIQDVISPNILDSWIKAFQLAKRNINHAPKM